MSQVLLFPGLKEFSTPRSTTEIVGFDQIGAASSGPGNNSIFAWYLGQVSNGGLLQSISCYTASTDANMNLAIYDGTESEPGNLIGSTGTVSPIIGFRTGNATGVIPGGTHVWLGSKHGASGTSMRHDNVSGYPFSGVGSTPFTDPFPNPYGAFTSSGSRRVSAFATVQTYLDPAIILNSPIEGSFLQRASGSTVDIELSGVAVNFTGDIEARYGNGAWQTVATIAADGAWSGTLTSQAVGLGAIKVRRVSPNTRTGTIVKNVMTGKLYLTTGDSISEGRLTNAQSSGSAFSRVFRQDNQWKSGADPTDTGTTNGSHWPLLAQLLFADDSIPVGFATAATGSRDIAGGNTSFAKNNTDYQMLTGQASRAGGDFEAILAHLGPNAALSAITQADYLAALTTWVSDLQTDVQAGVDVRIGVFGRSNATIANNPPVRRAIAEALATGVTDTGPNLLGPNWTDGVHPKTDAEAAIIASRWFAALKGVAAPNITHAYLQPDDTKVQLVFDADLGESNGTTYTVGLFTVDGANPTATEKIAARRVELTFASARSVGQPFVYVPGEQHIGATMPSSVALSLPIAVHGVASVVQPTNPVALTVVAEP